MEGGRLSPPRLCSKGVQPISKAVHCSGCPDKHSEIWTWVLSHCSHACYHQTTAGKVVEKTKPEEVDNDCDVLWQLHRGDADRNTGSGEVKDVRVKGRQVVMSSRSGQGSFYGFKVVKFHHMASTTMFAVERQHSRLTGDVSLWTFVDSFEQKPEECVDCLLSYDFTDRNVYYYYYYYFLTLGSIWSRGISKIRSITKKTTKLAGMTCHIINKAVMKLKRWINTLIHWKRKLPSRVSPETSAIRQPRPLGYYYYY